MLRHVRLPDRAFISVSGDDRSAFLQGLITQDVAKLDAGTPLLYSALLTPQGKYLFDFFLWYSDDGILIETDYKRADELRTTLSRYKLRKNVTLGETRVADIHQIWGGDGAAPPGAIRDPRHEGLGWRSLIKPDGEEAPLDEWTQHRLQFDVPDCPHDLRVGLSSPFEGNIDLLNGISFSKGCYMGQELVSRIHHRGLVKRRFPNL